MKLVIDLPDEEYKSWKSDGLIGVIAIRDALQNATPLEKVFEDIKSDIDAKQYSYMSDKDYDDGIRFGLMLAYQIVEERKKNER